MLFDGEKITIEYRVVFVFYMLICQCVKSVVTLFISDRWDKTSLLPIWSLRLAMMINLNKIHTLV